MKWAKKSLNSISSPAACNCLKLCWAAQVILANPTKDHPRIVGFNELFNSRATKLNVVWNSRQRLRTSAAFCPNVTRIWSQAKRWIIKASTSSLLIGTATKMFSLVSYRERWFTPSTFVRLIPLVEPARRSKGRISFQLILSAFSLTARTILESKNLLNCESFNWM